MSAPSAQQPAAKSLGKPDAEFTSPFTDVTSIRELRDGRVIASDRRERVVQRIDFSTLLVDPMNRRMLYIDTDAQARSVLAPGIQRRQTRERFALRC